MSKNYSPELPVSKQNQVKVTYPPAFVSKGSTTKENAAASSILLLTHNTTEIEVAVTANTAGKWLSQATIDSSVAGTSVLTAAGSANYDFVIAANTVQRLVIPIATHNPSYGSIQGVNRAEGLYPAVAYKTFAGNGSVLTVQK